MQTGVERVINQTGSDSAGVAADPRLQPPATGGFLTSIASVRSDIYLIEGFRLPRTWWERIWRTGSPLEPSKT